MDAGIIPTRDGRPLTPLPTYDPAEGDAVTRELWNLQVGFDENIHAGRDLLFPCDMPIGEQDDIKLRWVWGECFAILQELDELREAIEAKNADEETVDILHFTMSTGNKLGIAPEELGVFSEVFDAAQAESIAYEDFEEAFHGVLPDMIMALNQMVGNSFKWWKNQPSPVDWEPVVTGLQRVHYLNMVMAATVFESWQDMYQCYTGKVAENHERQEGTVAGREDYQAA